MAKYEQSLGEVHAAIADMTNRFGPDAPIVVAYVRAARLRDDWAEPSTKEVKP